MLPTKGWKVKPQSVSQDASGRQNETSPRVESLQSLLLVSLTKTFFWPRLNLHAFKNKQYWKKFWRNETHRKSITSLFPQLFIPSGLALSQFTPSPWSWLFPQLWDTQCLSQVSDGGRQGQKCYQFYVIYLSMWPSDTDCRLHPHSPPPHPLSLFPHPKPTAQSSFPSPQSFLTELCCMFGWMLLFCFIYFLYFPVFHAFLYNFFKLVGVQVIGGAGSLC